MFRPGSLQTPRPAWWLPLVRKTGFTLNSLSFTMRSKHSQLSLSDNSKPYGSMFRNSQICSACGSHIIQTFRILVIAAIPFFQETAMTQLTSKTKSLGSCESSTSTLTVCARTKPSGVDLYCLTAIGTCPGMSLSWSKTSIA